MLKLATENALESQVVFEAEKNDFKETRLLVRLCYELQKINGRHRDRNYKPLTLHVLSLSIAA